MCDVRLPLHFGGEDELQLSFPFPGLYRLQAMTLRRLGSELGVGGNDHFVPIPVTFDVLESDAGAHRELDLPANLLDLADPSVTPR